MSDCVPELRTAILTLPSGLRTGEGFWAGLTAVVEAAHA
jgi:hypothetical protein